MTVGFRALRVSTFRLWFGAALVANVGEWAQRTAQDWLVLTELTDHDGGATGTVVAMQFLPVLLLAPWAGVLVDRFPVRRLLVAGQLLIGSSALASTLLVLTGKAQLWSVVLCALWLGCGSALSLPARQVFVTELVPHGHLTSAIGLNGLAMNVARMLGPAAAGVIIAHRGTAAAFAVGVGCAAAVAVSLLWLRTGRVVRQRAETAAGSATGQDDGSLRSALAYLRHRPDLVTVLGCSALVSLFAAHTALNVVMMATTVLGQDASRLAVFATAVAAGSITGSLLATRRRRPGFGVLAFGALTLSLASLAAASAPGVRGYTVALFPLGLGVMTFFLTSTTMVQLATHRSVQGRVVGLLSVIQVGTMAIGAPLVGWIGTVAGARWTHACAAAAALAVGVVCLVTSRMRADVVTRFSQAVAVLEHAQPRRTVTLPPGPDDQAVPAQITRTA